MSRSRMTRSRMSRAGMGRRRRDVALRTAPAAGAALALAMLLAVAFPAAGLASAVHTTATLAPQSILFGDEVHARLDVVVDPSVAAPGALRLVTPLGAWTQVGPTVVRTTTGAGLVRRSYRLTLVCRTAACLPKGASQLFQLPAATVTVSRRAGAALHVRVRWPALLVGSRLPAGAAAAAKPPFQLQVAPPTVRPRIAPSTTTWLLAIGAAALVAVALACATPELRRRRRAGRAPLSPLERALALAHEAEARPPADRRRALALLARVAPGPDDGIASDAATVAWSESDPSPEQLAELARRVAKREPPVDEERQR
jgi:hypothetical protein